MLFNGLPIQKGIPEIIENSEYEFNYGKSIYLLGNSEKWFTEIEKFEYQDSPTKRIELELGQNSQEEELGCYNTSLRLFYEDAEIMKEEFFKIKEEFEKLGEKVDTETTMSEDYELKEQLVIVYFKKGNLIPNLAFSFNVNSITDDFQVFVNYQNCLNLNKEK